MGNEKTRGNLAMVMEEVVAAMLPDLLAGAIKDGHLDLNIIENGDVIAYGANHCSAKVTTVEDMFLTLERWIEADVREGDTAPLIRVLKKHTAILTRLNQRN